jgi:hypothetical protein
LQGVPLDIPLDAGSNTALHLVVMGAAEAARGEAAAASGLRKGSSWTLNPAAAARAGSAAAPGQALAADRQAALQGGSGGAVLISVAADGQLRLDSSTGSSSGHTGSPAAGAAAIHSSSESNAVVATVVASSEASAPPAAPAAGAAAGGDDEQLQGGCCGLLPCWRRRAPAAPPVALAGAPSTVFQRQPSLGHLSSLKPRPSSGSVATAGSLGAYVACINQLAAAGANGSCRNALRQAPLHLAVRVPADGAAQRLASALLHVVCTDVDAADASGVTPLMAAAQAGASRQLLESLLAAGANPRLMDTGRRSALTYAAQRAGMDGQPDAAALPARRASKTGPEPAELRGSGGGEGTADAAGPAAGSRRQSDAGDAAASSSIRTLCRWEA